MGVESRKSSGLGRGLASLIPTAPSGVSVTREIPLSAISPNPEQPRRTFDPDELQQLVDSIAAHGLLQPIIVVESGDGYVLIAGERRLRAITRLQLETIPAVVRTANEQERLELALVENIQRSDLNALDEARAYRHLMDEYGLTQERVAERVGRSRPAVANTLRVLETAPGVQQAVATGTISGGHARALAGLDDHAQQGVFLAAVVARSLSVRQTEGLVQASRKSDDADRPRRARAVDPDIQNMEAQMREALGTKVTIASSRKGGRITITWYDDEDLGRLVDRLAAN
ncbi:MAG: ParB/RepB/Spo0J family partition protein [Chloroflexota bacterium]|nr:ParB/RepB/Spo0J family partition protein [Chloroflexota bacterium]